MSSGAGLTKVTLQADWYPQPEHGGFYTALVKGYYKDAGLDVTIRPGGPYVVVEEQVAAGAAQFGMSSSDKILESIADGQPLVAVAATMQHDPQGIMVRKDSPIHSFADLNGHTVAIKTGSTWWEYIEKRYQLNDVHEVPAMMNVANFVADPQYIQQAIPLMETLIACVVAASLIGALGPVGGREAVRRLVRSKALTAGLVGIVLLSMVVVPLDAVNGTAPNLVTNSSYFLTPVVVGGFNSDPNVRTTGVSANFSFQGTNVSSIQSDNFLAAGIGIHSPNCCVDGIDYGYRADVFLYHNASEVFAASAWEVCDTILACGGHTWKHLMYFSSTRVNSSLESDFQLSVRWENDALSWFYSSSNETRLVASYQATRQQNPYFDAGWLGSSSTPSPGGWPFFQFGVMSAFPIGHSGWRVTIACPSIVLNSTRACIDHAEFFQGDISFWKALWRWGENYPNAGATVNPEAKTMTFQYSQASVQDFQTAW
ncbi:MAG: ABC transporter substrate-binding protein [Nitrososphaerales archaeon]